MEPTSLLRLALTAVVIALLPLSWWWLSQRRAALRARLSALTLLTLFLTFDLIVFGSFTRLTDSGLGCPDWPGCYGLADPLAAAEPISAAQAALPSGPVTHSKAWIEMIHRYWAMAVGVLILVAAWMGWRRRRELPLAPWWPLATLAWVIAQGLFGKYTVTQKLYPAVVTLHLLGGLVLLALLVRQHEAYRTKNAFVPVHRLLVAAALGVLFVQAALGGWVSTNYAVLACSGFPQCNGQWWPEMDAARGFEILRHLGRSADGGFLPVQALVAIQLTHRLFALVAVVALVMLVVALRRSADSAAVRYAWALIGLLALQLISGISNVVLDWPLAAALVHSAGAAALIGILVSLWARSSVPRAAVGAGRIDSDHARTGRGPGS